MLTMAAWLKYKKYLIKIQKINTNTKIYISISINTKILILILKD